VKSAPKKRDAIRSVRAVECLLQTLDIVNISGHDFRAQLRQFLGLGSVDVPGECARSESTVRITHDGPDHAAALRARRSEHRNNLFSRHDSLLLKFGFAIRFPTEVDAASSIPLQVGV
jgi:hypothetical protein